MKYLTIWVLAALLGMFVFGCGEDACESEEFTEDYQFRSIFECPSCVNEPADLVMYRDYTDGVRLTTFFNTAREMAEVWFDETCVEECEVTPPQTECLEADCMTDAGAAMIYSYVTTDEEWIEADMYYMSTHTVEEILTIIPPEGAETWESITIEKSDLNEDLEEYRYTSSAYVIDWLGALKEEWPPSFHIGGYTYSGWGMDTRIERTSWSHENCQTVTHFSYVNGEHGPRYSIETNDNIVIVEEVDHNGPWEGIVNGDSVGLVNPDTWEIIGD